MAAGGREFKGRPFALHPLLFALAPILFLYSHNAARLPIAPSELVLPLAVSFAAALCLWLVLWLVMHSSRRSALVVSLFLALFFLYGRVADAIGAKAAPGILPWAAGGILLLGVIFFARSRREFGGLTVFLNLVSVALVLINLVAGAPALLRGEAAKANAPGAVQAEIAGQPDIYYVILDGYARDDILNSIYGYDNSGFIGWLNARGFTVARNSRSNYSQTYLSLASSLNMTYLDSVANRLGPESENRSSLVRMIGDSRVVKELRRRGYTIASFASGYTGTDLANADIHFAPRWALSEFQNVLISTTALPLILDRLLRKSQFDLHRERILYAFEHLPDAARLKHPAFVFCHILSPHPPFVFGAKGEKVDPQGYFKMTEGGSFQTVDKENVRRDYVEKYRTQLEFITSKTKATVERILEVSPRRPVIILQADHGPGSVLNWDDPEPAELAERFAILNACSFDSPPAESITPVNRFRVLFDSLFNTDYGRLPNRSWFSTIAKPWHFYDADRPAEYMKDGTRLRVSVVAFRADTQPKNPGAYCRRLVAMQYPGATVTIERFSVQGAGEAPVEDVGKAYQRYRDAVARRELPDLGAGYESYHGPGPDRIPVTALFFTSER